MMRKFSRVHVHKITYYVETQDGVLDLNDYPLISRKMRSQISALSVHTLARRKLILMCVFIFS